MFSSFRFFLLLCLAPLVRAESFTLDSAVSRALRDNPGLGAARFGIAEARARLLQAGRLSNPELESEVRPNVRGREYSLDVGLMQRFPLTGRLRLEKAVSLAELAAAEAEVRVAERQLAGEVRAAGIRLLSLRDSRLLKEKRIANSRELAAVAARTAAAGEGSGLEAAQLELEARQLSLELLQLESERAVLVGAARPLLGLAPDRTVEFTGILSLPATAGAVRPDPAARAEYQAALARIEAAQQGVALAKARRWEDAGVGLSAGLDRAEDAPDGLQTDGTIGIRFSLPLPFWNHNEGKIEEAAATAARAAKEAEAVAATVHADAAAASGEMEAARKVLTEINVGLLPGAAALEEKFRAHWQSALPGASLTDVLRARENHLTLEQARLDALRTWHLARIRLDAAMGR